MKPWRFVLVLTLFSAQAFAQEQMAVRLNASGIMKILKLAIKYNAGSEDGKTIVIPKNTYEFTLPKEKLHSNPIIPIVNEISDLNLNKNLNFYLNTSDIKINGKVDVDSLKVSIFNSHLHGFDVRLSISLPEVSVIGDKLTLCEDKHRYENRCGDGLKASLTRLSMKTISHPLVVTAVLRFKTDYKVARVTVVSVDSNLDSNRSPGLDMNFKSVDVPRIAIVINGQETELNTSKLKDEIIKKKIFLGKKLLGFAASFIAGDVAEMLNVYLVNQEVATSYQIFKKNNPMSFNDLLEFSNNIFSLDQYAPNASTQANSKGPIFDQISKIVRSAQVDIALHKISTPSNRNIELSGVLDFVLNGSQISVRNTIGNSHQSLPAVNLISSTPNDIGLAISEPLINGILDVANSTNLFQKIFAKVSPIKGVSIRDVKLHFASRKSLVAVVNAEINLKKIESKGLSSRIKNGIASFLESNNNDSIIYFPLEISMIPNFTTLENGDAGLDLFVMSPFSRGELLNNFNYPSNVPEMYGIVRDGVMEQLQGALVPHLNKNYSVNLSEFLNKSGVEFSPKSISISKDAYLMINLDINDIKFNSKNPTQK